MSDDDTNAAHYWVYAISSVGILGRMLERARKLYAKVWEFLDWFDDSPLRVGWTLVGAAIVGVIWLDWGYLQRSSSKELFDGVVVELNGGLVDIVLFGLVVVWFDSRREERQKQREKETQRQAQIDEWKDQLSDFRDWKSEESAHRTAGIVRRLARAGEEVYAPFAYLESASFNGLNLAGANLFGANLAGAILRGARLKDVKNLDKAKNLNLAFNLDEAKYVPPDILEAWKAAEPERLEHFKKNA